MLPAAARLTRREEFASTIKCGTRAGRSRLVVHLELPADRTQETVQGTRVSGLQSSGPARASARAGFVVSKAVGNAVVRHRVARRLRHLVAPRLGSLPHGARLVVRALPPAATASSAELGTELDSALRSAQRSVQRAAQRPGRAGGRRD